jgi:hypothetical protein
MIGYTVCNQLRLERSGEDDFKLNYLKINYQIDRDLEVIQGYNSSSRYYLG